MFSQKRWEELNPQQHAWIEQAMEVTVTYQKALWKADTEVALNALKKAGVTIIYPDKAPFQERVESFKQSFTGTPVGDILEKIEAKR